MSYTLGSGLTVITVSHLPVTPGSGVYADCATAMQCADINNRMIQAGVSGPVDFLEKALESRTYVHPFTNMLASSSLGDCCNAVQFNGHNHAVQCHQCGRVVDTLGSEALASQQREAESNYQIGLFDQPLESLHSGPVALHSL